MKADATTTGNCEKSGTTATAKTAAYVESRGQAANTETVTVKPTDTACCELGEKALAAGTELPECCLKAANTAQVSPTVGACCADGEKALAAGRPLPGCCLEQAKSAKAGS
jgi:hypothetical protein